MKRIYSTLWAMVLLMGSQSVFANDYYLSANGGVMRVQEAFDKLNISQCSFVQNSSDMTGGCYIVGHKKIVLK